MSAANRFVRFGYRRPPPWKSSPAAEFLSSPGPQTNIPKAIRSVISKNTLPKWGQICTDPLKLKPVHVPQRAQIPSLAHGMETVLRGDGLYPMEAPWTKHQHRRRKPRTSTSSRPDPLPPVFTDGLRRIVQPNAIAWHEIPSYVPASKDDVLHAIADRTEGIRFCSSTSSITPVLSIMYHLISNFRDTALNGGLSTQIKDLPSTFAKMHRRPVAISVSRNRPSSQSSGSTQPVYTINAHNGMDRGPSILRDLGHSMERMLTTPPDQFANKYVSQEPCADERTTIGGTSAAEQFYHYTQVSDLLLRAQIDCVNEATGEVFDVKTRAVAPIRYDLENYTSFTSHRLRFLSGRHDSYEREFYDMVRTVFLKYALQLRIGRMAGALVAYHNTTEVLGVEYIGLSEMESYVFGDPHSGDKAFATSVRLLERVLQEVLQAMPLAERTTEDGESLKIVLYPEWTQLKMYVFVQRVRHGEADAFSYEEFAKRESNVPLAPDNEHADAFRTSVQWHLDSFLHSRLDGVAAIGAHTRLQMLGGVAMNRSGEVPMPRRASGAQFTDRRLFDCNRLTKDVFRVWELSVVSLVNGDMVPRVMASLGDGDDFQVRYRLEEVKEIGNEHLSKFVSGLGGIYCR